MPQQKGILSLKGTMGNITFYKGKEGYLAREKGGVDAKRIASDPAFQRTRENGAEFGRAGKAGKLIRREKEIMCLICLEYSNKEISDKVHLSVRTVEGLRSQIMTTTNSRSTAGIVTFAIRNNIHPLI